MSYIIEEDHGTYTGTRHRHNGYYAGDFSRTPMRTPEQLAAIARMRPPNLGAALLTPTSDRIAARRSS